MSLRAISVNMAEKKFRGAPFGTQTARFDVSGVHPKSKFPGTYTEIPYDKKSMDELNRRLGPGSYAVDHGGFSKKTVEEKAAGPGWARAFEVERMAALPHLLHKEQWEMKKMLTRKLGPGSYNIKDFLEYGDEKPRSYRGICQTKAVRFKDANVNETPGPGTYGDGGVPHAAKEAKEKQSTSTIGLLDAGSSTPRNLPSVNPVGAGRYDVQKWEEAQHRNGHNSVFKSKTGKLSAEMEKFLKERVRGKDVQLEERVFIVTPEPPLGYGNRLKNPQTDLVLKKSLTVV
ncbi:hypothetical protein KUTeg_016184 [Tegillarca granosa]|uniref:Uncharacterized protein n=1 Tax=Tegillarca granosa TaxID=220873 RepID=A0ABQ9EL74_TEGGR|nr:hypothetical protein KUTeg_016184 [Tegillarca granosa]